jgi:hypothetical protein
MCLYLRGRANRLDLATLLQLIEEIRQETVVTKLRYRQLV